MVKAYNWLAVHSLVASLLAVLLVAVPGYLRIEQMFSCAQTYAEKSYVSTTTVREIAQRRDDAEDQVWDAASRVFTQQAGQDDYAALQDAIIERDRLSDELAKAREDNPIPDPPESFC